MKKIKFIEIPVLNKKKKNQILKKVKIQIIEIKNHYNYRTLLRMDDDNYNNMNIL